MKIKKVVLISILVLLIISIFIFSGQDGTKSINTSDAFASLIIDKVANITKKDISTTRKQELVIKTRFIVRKIAHFALYFVLGIIIYLFASIYFSKKTILISICICILLASIDELHQLFTVGRTAQIYDVIVDTLGSGSGIALTWFITSIIKKRKLLSK